MNHISSRLCEPRFKVRDWMDCVGLSQAVASFSADAPKSGMFSLKEEQLDRAGKRAHAAQTARSLSRLLHSARFLPDRCRVCPLSRVPHARVLPNMESLPIKQLLRDRLSG